MEEGGMHEGVRNQGPPSPGIVIIACEDQMLVDEAPMPIFAPLSQPLLDLIIGVEIIGVSRTTNPNSRVCHDIWFVLLPFS